MFFLGTEEDGKSDAYQERITCEDEPAGLPVAHQIAIIRPVAIVINHHTRQNSTYGCTQAIGHQHEQSLGRGSHLDIALLVDKETARHIEEIERHAINDAREHEEAHAREGWIAEAEEAESEHPCKHGDEHDFLDAVPLHEERNEQDTQCL